VPAGNVADQGIDPGLQAARDTRVDYVVSQGPEPTPSPTPSPTPTPEPTPTPTPEPTPTPTPPPLTVDDYVCLTVEDAVEEIDDDGFGAVVEPPEAQDAWFVATQNPPAGEELPPGSDIEITAQEAEPEGC
jgi:beta-lactam-binding protein with PASTA domain